MTQQITEITGPAVPLRGADIDTDRIIPARYLRCVTFDGLGEFAFEDDRAQDPDHPFNQACYQGARLLFAGENFGCGSSREHAPQALNRWGIQAVVALSFAEIFFGNCLAMGVPCATVSGEDLEALYAAAEAEPQRSFRLDVAACELRSGDLCIRAEIPPGPRESLLNGTWNATLVLQEAGSDIDAVAQRLPYIQQFG